MAEPKRVLYFAENALSAIQGGGIVAYAVLRGLPADRLLGFYDYRNITPVPEYADRFQYLGPWRMPALARVVDRVTGGRAKTTTRLVCAERAIRRDLRAVQHRVEREGFRPEVVYFSGLSYRYLRLAVMAAEHYGVPMLVLHMDDWMAVEKAEAGIWGSVWSRRIVRQMTRAAARSLVSTTNSPRLAHKVTDVTGFRHTPANNCCSDLMPSVTTPSPPPNPVPVLTYAGAMNPHLQGETLTILAGAVTELNAEGTPVHLHIYTPWEFAPAANAVAVPNAVYYKGQVGRAQLADAYLASDFLVTTVTHRERHIPLFRHSLSTKLSEYLCLGKPVISMGHRDWHLHEYVQDHGCGFSIPMDEHYSRAQIKAQLRRILALDRRELAEIGRRNRARWEQGHDVTVMARPTRQAVGLEDRPIVYPAGREERRGAVWVGRVGRNLRWIPIYKLQTICLRLCNEYGVTAVDFIGADLLDHPELERLHAYCHEIGVRPVLVGADVPRWRGWDPAATRWSLAPAQRHPDGPVDPTTDVFDQVAALRGERAGVAPSVPQRAINQLSVLVSEAGPRPARVWLYGSAVVGRDVMLAIERHSWLGTATEIAGFLSSPGMCAAESLHGRAWRAVDEVDPADIDFVVCTSETSRFAIQQELASRQLLPRMIPVFGMVAERSRFERRPASPGQAFDKGATAADYASREVLEHIRCVDAARLGLSPQTVEAWTRPPRPALDPVRPARPVEPRRDFRRAA